METAAFTNPTAYELAHGKPRPDLLHASIQANLIVALSQQLRGRCRVVGPVQLATGKTSATPDVSVFEARALDYLNREQQGSHRPLNVVEIQAFSQPTDAVIRQLKTYFQFGVRSCWVVQPAIQGILVFEDPKRYAFFHADDTLRDAALGLELPLAPVFA